MKNKYLVVISLLFLVSILLYGCQEESGDTVSLVVPPVEGPAVGDSGSTAHIDQPGGLFVYTQNLGSTPQDVYFIFTNTGASNITPATEVSSASSMSYKEKVNNQSNLQKNLTELQQQYLIEYTNERGMRIKDSPLATQFNANPPKFGDMVEKSKSFVDVPPPLYADTTGDTLNFMNESTSDLIAATLRLQIVTDSKTVNLWVANDSWTGCSKANCMTQAMVQAFGDKFLISGTSNDIWDWISSVYGAPWGTHAVPNLIDSSISSQIDILFFDISGDNSTTGGILGFFWAKDNYKNTGTSSIPYSNQRLMFYIDSVLTATPEGGTWEITDEWPAEMVSTLSHEFQHMINFYQKNVVRTNNVSSETWINEMASMVAEDLIADKLGIDGPRGVTYNDGTAGSSGNTNGRLPLYNGFSNLPLTTWLTGSNVLISYAMNYSFGAYIVRNFGGAELMQKITQSTFTGTDAIDNALSDLGFSETFSTILKKWGASVLRSDLTSNTSGYQYNTGSFITSTFGSDTHNLGSINLFNFDYGTQSGPLLYSPASLVSYGGHYSTSNTFVLIGQNLTGEFSKKIEMPSGISLSVVTKNSN